LKDAPVCKNLVKLIPAPLNDLIIKLGEKMVGKVEHAVVRAVFFEMTA
jgi:hypothetical protein